MFVYATAENISMSQNALDRVAQSVVFMMRERDETANLADVIEKEHCVVHGFKHGSDASTHLVFVLREGIKPIVAILRVLRTLADKNGAARSIVVCETKPTYSAARLLEAWDAEFFEYTDLLFPVVAHSMVPRHRLMTKEEEKTVLTKLGVKSAQLPRLKRSDPVARFYNFPENSVIEIHRCNGLQQRSLFYRLVSPA